MRKMEDRKGHERVGGTAGSLRVAGYAGLWVTQGGGGEQGKVEKNMNRMDGELKNLTKFFVLGGVRFSPRSPGF